MTINSAVTALLDKNHIAFDVIEIPLSENKKPIRNLEELLRAQDKDPDSVVRSLLFKTPSAEFVLLAAAGGERVDWAVLRKHLGQRKLQMAEFDDVPEVTGYQVGAVPPIALPDTIRIVIDNQIKNYDDVIIGSGVLGYALALTTTDLLGLMTTAETGIFLKKE